MRSYHIHIRWEMLYFLYSQAEHTDGQITGFDKQAIQVCDSVSKI